MESDEDLFGDEGAFLDDEGKPKGLYLLKNIISKDHLESIQSSIHQSKWFSESDQKMCFGKVPSFLDPLQDIAFPYIHRYPLFDQMIANFYHPGYIS